MNRIILVLVAFGVVGCNIEESDNSTSQDYIPNSTSDCTPRSYEELSRYGYGCKETIPGGTGGSSGGIDSGGTATVSSQPSNIARYAEYEPNNAPENANPVAFPTVSGDTVPGIEITGSVKDVSDESDYFILSPNQGGIYAIYLCADTCTEHPTDSMVALGCRNSLLRSGIWLRYTRTGVPVQTCDHRLANSHDRFPRICFAGTSASDTYPLD
jgi:hypothetical protein